MITLLCFVLLGLLTSDVNSCTQRSFGESSYVCVCDDSQCDYIIGEQEAVSSGQFRVTHAGIDDWLTEELLDIEDNNQGQGDFDITLDTSQTFQSMIGWGGAFTDSAGLNILTLPQNAQNNLMRTYFGPDGLDYNLARVPIAGSDFSTRPYSYDDVDGDVDLENWALTDEDYDYKLPFMQQAISISNQDFYILGSPWAPPAWMKTNGMFNGSGTLLPEMRQPWANYIVKFIDAYESELGIQLWGLTPQNEPLSGFEDWGWNTCGWTAEDMRDWIKDYLGPTLETAGYRRLQMLVDDYNRDTLPDYPLPMTSDPDCSQYFDGIAVHWYSDRYGVSPSVLDQTHSNSPDKYILYTEASEGYYVDSVDESVLLGSWERGEAYITNIIEDCNHWVTGWIDWNLALDMGGGPNWANNWLDSPIIINAESNEFYIQPMHAALAMFSRNVKRNALKISIDFSNGNNDLDGTAFVNPDGTVAVVLANTGTRDLSFTLNDENGKVLVREIGARTWETIVYMR